MANEANRRATPAPQKGHNGAISRVTLSLRARLAVLVVVAIALVIGVEAYLQVRVLERSVETDLLEIARSTAQTVADSVDVGDRPRDAAEVTRNLHEFAEAVPAIRAISLVHLRDGEPVAFASTSSNERGAALAAGAAALASKQPVEESLGALRTVAVPTIGPGEPAAAVVTVSLASFEQARERGQFLTLVFAPAVIIVLTVTVDLLMRRFVHKPIAAIRQTMRRAGTGELDARVSVERADELGAVASGLNEMLTRMQNFNVELQDRITEATTELRLRNSELAESIQRMFTLREALARAEQMAAVGQAAATVAHQIGTPLNLISGYVQMMIEEARGDSRIRRRLELLEEQIRKVTSIVRTLLEHVRRPSRPHQPSRIVDLVERVCEVSRPALSAAGVKLQLRILGETPPVEADAEELELALLNLVSNGLDAMPAGGELEITVSATADGVKIEVADTGTGIQPELLPRIFEPWVTNKAIGHGTGLGLSIARNAIVAHGGTIAARNRPGPGAVFTIELPRAPTVGTWRES